MDFERIRRARIAVTGGNGFLGRALVRRLRGLGCDVRAPRAKEYDLVDREAVRRFYRDLGPEIVLHLAARVGGIGANRANPAVYFHDNLMMGTQVLDEAWRSGVKKVVALGTICAYPKFAPIPFREDEIWNGYPEETNAPYGLAKKMLLVQSQAYRAQYGFNSVVLFPVNLYGPEDNFDLETSHVIPAMIRKFVEARDRGESTVTLWGDGSPSREFLFVEDCVEAILLAAERYDASDPVNVGSGAEIVMSDLARKIAFMTGFSGQVIWDTTKPNGQPRRRLDVMRAEERFGFRARTDFDAGLRATIDWFERERREGRCQTAH